MRILENRLVPCPLHSLVLVPRMRFRVLIVSLVLRATIELRTGPDQMLLPWPCLPDVSTECRRSDEEVEKILCRHGGRLSQHEVIKSARLLLSNYRGEKE